MSVRLSRAVLGLATACVIGSFALVREDVTPTAPLLAGCFEENCSFTRHDVPSEAGYFVDADTWMSAPLYGEWAEFGGNTAVVFHPDFQGRIPYDWSLLVSVSPTPELTGNLISVAAGNLALVNGQGPNSLTVSNTTCSQYYLRVVIFAAPHPPAPAPVDPDAGDGGDAGTDEAGVGDAGGNDAGGDASTD